MAIIVEGFDNSGKSTLAASFGLDVVHPGSRPKDALEEIQCLTRQLDQARMPIVMDRITCVSTPCYTGAMREPYADYLSRMVETKHCVLIYCRPPLEIIKDFSRHVAKSYDEEKQIRWLNENAERIVDNYDLMMTVVPHMKYDYTKPDTRVVQAAYDAQFTLREWKRCRDLMAIR